MLRRPVDPDLLEDLVAATRDEGTLALADLLQSSLDTKWDERDDSDIMDCIRLIGGKLTHAAAIEDTLVVRSQQMEMTVAECGTALVGYLFSKLHALQCAPDYFGPMRKAAGEFQLEQDPTKKEALWKLMRSDCIEQTRQLRRIHVFQELFCGGQAEEVRVATVLAAVSVFFQPRKPTLSIATSDGVDLGSDPSHMVPLLALARVLIALGILKQGNQIGPLTDEANRRLTGLRRKMIDSWSHELGREVAEISKKEKFDFSALFYEQQLCWASPLCVRTVHPRVRQKARSESTPQVTLVDEDVWKMLDFAFQQDDPDKGLQQLFSFYESGDASPRTLFLLELSKVAYFIQKLRKLAQLSPFKGVTRKAKRRDAPKPWLGPEKAVFLFWQDLGEPRLFEFLSRDESAGVSVQASRPARLPLVIQMGWRSWLIYDRDTGAHQTCHRGFFDAMASFWMQANTVAFEKRAARERNYLSVICKAMGAPVAGER